MQVRGLLLRGKQSKRSSPGDCRWGAREVHTGPWPLAPIPRLRCGSCIAWGSPWNLGSASLIFCSWGHQDQTDTLVPKGSTSPLPGPPGISLKHFAAPQWLPEEKQGLVLQARSRKMCGLRFAGRIWPLAFIPCSSRITPDHSLPQPPAVPFSPATVVSQTLFTCLLETPLCHPGPELSLECPRAETYPQKQALQASAPPSFLGSALFLSLASPSWSMTDRR